MASILHDHLISGATLESDPETPGDTECSCMCTDSIIPVGMHAASAPPTASAAGSLLDPFQGVGV